MNEFINNHFGLTEEDVEAQALNEEVTANAATSVNNEPACEGEVEDLDEAGGAPADEELDSSSNHGVHEQKPLLKVRVVHTLKKKTLGKVFVIKSNRRDPRQIKAKQRSCLKHGMLVSALFVDATAAFDAGYVLVNPITGEVVKNREETFGKLVIMEGNIRFWAWLAEVERIKEEKRKSKGKEVKKADVQSLLAGKVPSVFNDGDTEDIELYQMIFDGVCEGFGIEKDAPIKNKVLKGTFIWHWTAKRIHEADEDSRIDVADKVINMFTGMSAQDSERINNAEKTESQTREQVIHGILNEMYNRNK